MLVMRRGKEVQFMVTKSKEVSTGKEKKIKVLKLNKETVRKLTSREAREIRGATGIRCLCNSQLPR